MAVHGPDVVSCAKKLLSNGFSVSLVIDTGKPQGVAFEGQWWRLERYIVDATEIIAAQEAILPAPTGDITVKSCTRSESAWYNTIVLPAAISAARAGTLNQFWAGKPSAFWWTALPAEVREGFTALLADCRP
jgi:hypothetical protein